MALTLITGVAACTDGLTQREETCLELTGNLHCKSEGDYAVQQARAENQLGYSAIQRGQSNTNYYGNEDYGYWGSDGQYRFNEPYGSHASSTNAFLLGAGLGALGAYSMSKVDWGKQNKGGWKASTNKSKKSHKRGKVSKAEKRKRAKQSRKDKAKHKASQKKQSKIKKGKPNKFKKKLAKPVTSKYSKHSKKRPQFKTRKRNKPTKSRRNTNKRKR